jgi:aminoglycoside phosphotransferase (APT) family kinase protein
MNAPVDQDVRLDNAATAIVRETLGEPVVSARQLSGGVMTYRCLVETGSGARYMVRFYPPSRRHVVHYEPAVLRRCREAGVPVPEVVADSQTGPQATLAYMVYRRVDGDTLAERLDSLDFAAVDSVAQQVVAVLGLLNQCPVAGCGELLDACSARHATWIEFVTTSFDEGIETLRRCRVLEPPLLDRLIALRDNLEAFEDSAPAGLVWGDIAPDNIILDKHGRLAALIDFEGALAAEPVLNLGYAYSALAGTPFFDALLRRWPGAESEGLRRKVAFYAVLRAVRIARYADQPLPTGAPRMAVDRLLPGFVPALQQLCHAD